MADELRRDARNDGTVEIPAQAFAHLMVGLGGRRGHFPAQLTLVAAIAWNGLKGYGSHHAQQFAQVGAASHAAHGRVDLLAPARPNRGADQAIEWVGGRRAFRKRGVAHCRHRRSYSERVVDRQADLHMVDGFAGGARTVAAGRRRIGLCVDQFGLEVPEIVSAQKSPSSDGAGVYEFA